MVQQLGNVAQVGEELITVHFPMAQIDMMDVIGQDTYEAILLAKDESFTTEDDPLTEQIESITYTPEDYKKLEQAESYLVLKYLIPTLNIESTGSGVTKATGFGDSRKENLSESDLEKITARYENNAMKILEKYVTILDVDEDGDADIINAGSLMMACIEDEDEAGYYGGDNYWWD